MSSTLIVRDVTLAVNGAPETRGQPEEHLRQRLEVAAGFEADIVSECIEVLNPIGGTPQSDVEALEALMILGLSQPEICADLGISALQSGRQLASVLEEQGQVEYAVAVLDLLAERHPKNKAVDRDLAGLMRRRGMANDLIERYHERARVMLKAGRTEEAVDSLREILLLDRSRKDVARMIRDLRFQENDEQRVKRRGRRIAIGALCLSLCLSLSVVREIHVRREYQALPGALPEDLTSMRARLGSVEEFVERYPIWHGSLEVLRERSQLRVDVTQLEEAIRVAEEKREAARLRREELAEAARERGRMLAGSGDFAAAIAEFEQSLELAAPDWPHRARVERDVEAITAWMEDNR
jgi:tetratricopeptide (TPR) repeat protein